MAVSQLNQNISESIDVLNEKYGFKADQVSEALELAIDTTKNYLHRKKIERGGSKAKSKRIPYFQYFLDKILENGIFPTELIISAIPVMGEQSFYTFIKEKYKEPEDTVLYIIDSSVEKFAANRLDINFENLFTNTFGPVSEESLTMASQQDPQLLADLIAHGSLQNYTKAVAVAKLGLSVDDTFIGFLRTLAMNQKSYLVREGAYKALANYFFEDSKKYSFLVEEFQKALKNETGPGVRKQINNLIEVMEDFR